MITWLILPLAVVCVGIGNWITIIMLNNWVYDFAKRIVDLESRR